MSYNNNVIYKTAKWIHIDTTQSKTIIGQPVKLPCKVFKNNNLNIIW